jgi:Xaa-Pro aminopeptidase
LAPDNVQAEADRVEGLRDAQAKATVLFDEIDARGIVRAGITERQASDEIRDLANELLGVERHWHKRIIRAGPNTLLPYRENPPDRRIEADDIAFADFGPIFEDWEADFGRTYVLGDDPAKHALRDTLPVVFAAGRKHFEQTPDITGEQLWHFMIGTAADHGYGWGGRVAGHILGEFPHLEAPGDEVYSDVIAGNDRAMRGLDRDGRVLHWILEVHLVDRERGIGGFYEELLDV